MRKLLIAALVTLLPMNAFAQTQPARPTQPAGAGSNSTLLIVAGAVGGLVVADLLTGGTLVRPLLGLARAVPAAPSPAVAAAIAAGAVPGTELMAATAITDRRVVSTMLRFLGLTAGAVAGAYLVDAVVDRFDGDGEDD
ncbi:conserved membrane hypothetical protein [uncultured Gammaproteobacteria bacterium]